MPAAFTSTPSVQVSGFGDRCRLTRCDRLLCDSCSSGQCFACGFLQIPPRGGHPCRPASGSPYRAHRGLAPPSRPASTTCTGTAPVKALRAMPGAQRKKHPNQGALLYSRPGIAKPDFETDPEMGRWDRCSPNIFVRACSDRTAWLKTIQKPLVWRPIITARFACRLTESLTPMRLGRER